MSVSQEMIFNCAEDFNKTMVNAVEFLHNVIARVRKVRPVFFRDMWERGPYQLGQGLTRTKFVHHGPIGETNGALTRWRQIEKSRPPGTNGPNDPGYDSCKQQAYVIDTGIERKNYTGYMTERRTRDLCVNDVKWDWEFEQQIGLLFEDIARVTSDEWENLGREAALYFSRKYVLTNSANLVSFSYNPLTSNRVTIPRGVDISTLSDRHLQWFYQFLEKQAPDAAWSNDAGMPIFAFSRHPVDFDQMIRADSAIRDDLRWSGMSDVLLDNYGKVKAWKGMAQLNDMEQPRFKVVSETETTITLERVAPYVDRPVSVGDAIDANPEYINAPYAIGLLPLKNAFAIRIPPAGPMRPGGGTMFGDQPSMNGEFYWVNPNAGTCDNLLKEKGHYYCRLQAFLEPMEHEGDMVSFLYKRCVQTPAVLCAPCAGTAGAKNVVGGTVKAIDLDGDNSYVEVELQLDACLPCESPSNVTVIFQDGTSVSAVLADDARAADYIYRIVFADAAAWVSANGGGPKTVTCA